jgi:hypothetical protein
MPNDFFWGAMSWRRARMIARHPRFHEGFIEGMAGLPFDYAKADRLSCFDQHRYENGRELAAECRCAGVCVQWRRRTRLPEVLKEILTGRVADRQAGRSGGPYRVRRTPLAAGKMIHG